MLNTLMMNPIDQIKDPEIIENPSVLSKEMIDRIFAAIEEDRSKMKKDPELKKLMEDGTCPMCENCDLTQNTRKEENWQWPIQLPPTM